MAAKRLMPWQFTIKALTRRKTHLAIILSSIILGVAVISSMANIYQNFGDKFSRQFRQYGANVAVKPKKGELDNKQLNKLVSFFGDKVVAYSALSFTETESDGKSLIVIGSDLEQLPSLFPYWQLRGKWPISDKEALLGRMVAEKLSLKQGQTLSIKLGEDEVAFRVSGVFQSGGVEDGQVFISQRSDISASRIGYLSIIGQGDFLKEKLNKAKMSYPNLVIQPISRLTNAEASVLERTSYLVWLVAIIILLTSVLAVTITLMAIVVERRSEIALKRALGAEPRQINKEFFSESLILGLSGGILGWFVGILLAQWLGKVVFSSLIVISWFSFFLALAVALLVSILAAIFPLKLALAVEPAVVLKGE